MNRIVYLKEQTENAPSYAGQHRRPDYLDDPNDEDRGIQLSNPFLQQVIPIILAVIIFIVLSVALKDLLNLINRLGISKPVQIKIRLTDVLIGSTIYLKTSIDFAIFIGRLMSLYPGWLRRIAIEAGTALGNAFGTVLILIIWLMVQKIEPLLALMILFASLVLFELAYAGLEHFANWQGIGGIRSFLYNLLDRPLELIVKIQKPILSKILPDFGEKFKGVQGLNWKGLFFFSISVPFILGMDDFAGYVPLFNLVNVYGFAVGVFFAHAILNILLFLSPKITIAIVRNEIIAFLGTLAFIGLAFFGFFEVFRILIKG